MARVRPILRHLLVCEEVVVEKNQISLLHLILNIYSKGIAAYPLLFREICVFAALTEVRGQGSFFLRLVQADSDEEVFRSQRRLHQFGDDPLKVHGMPFRIRNCLFPEMGLYYVQFWFNDILLAHQDLFLR